MRQSEDDLLEVARYALKTGDESVSEQYEEVQSVRLRASFLVTLNALSSTLFVISSCPSQFLSVYYSVLAVMSFVVCNILSLLVDAAFWELEDNKTRRNDRRRIYRCEARSFTRSNFWYLGNKDRRGSEDERGHRCPLPQSLFLRCCIFCGEYYMLGVGSWNRCIATRGTLAMTKTSATNGAKPTTSQQTGQSLSSLASQYSNPSNTLTSYGNQLR